MKKFIIFMLTILLVASLAGCGQKAKPEAAKGGGAGKAVLPANMSWTSYDVTASGYIHAAAIADALNKKFGSTVRIIPSGTSMGRIMPLMQGKATYGFLGDEAMFAADGTFDFADITKGPQDIRTVVAKPSTIAFFTTKENYEKGMKTPFDFKGKRVPYVPGSPTTNVKVDAFLAYAGLTRNDVQVVTFPSFGASCRGLIERTVDMSIAVPTGPVVYEIDSSPVGLYRLEFPAAEKEAWARFHEVLPTFYPTIEKAGPAIHKKDGIEEVGFKFPHIVTYSKTSADEVYALTKAIAESYDLYKNVDALAPAWQIKSSSGVPVSAPYHEGAIRYFKEIGVWTDKHEAWNQQALKKVAVLQQAWKQAVTEGKEKGLTGAAFADFWMKKREEALKTLK